MDYMNKEKYMDETLLIVYGDSVLGLHGEGFSYLFSYVKGGLESLVIDGKEWLYRTPKPAFWRAVTDNDRGNGFPLRSGMWMGADSFISYIGGEVMVDGSEIPLPIAPENNKYTGNERAKKVYLKFFYETITVPSTKVEVAYEVCADGKINVHVRYHGNDKLPELPVFGIRFVMPTKAVGYRYEGLSGETYPDRMAGGISGIYDIDGLPVTKYLVPQDCNVHMKTKWLEVYRDTTLNNADQNNKTFGLKFSAMEEGKEFAFSCIPYTPLELENASHHEELPPARRTVVSILGAVRGVGGIDSWGADVEPDYRINAGKDINYSFRISKASINN
ncbi:beta-galactosidase [Kineothrix alysoides]|uniref:beta-galactosidase n=1 Tax=Kineothrix alysoides TaxID=1469948 RepID=A0A4R1QZM8_9FIRM|nr:beta-galactosidase small subunit [Kineothrix alysoides]TCL58450.1 beta-galactosidase [Kineothrix alysoides]